MLRKVAELGDGYIGRRITIKRDLVETQNGKQFTYESAKVADAVAILAILPNGGVVLVRNHRYPIGKTILEVPAGKLEEGETNPLERAKQELKEETGYTAAQWSEPQVIFTSPGITTEKIYCYVTHELTKGEQQLEDSEMGMEVVEVPASEIMDVWLSNEIDAKTSVMLGRYLALRNCADKLLRMK